MRQCSVAQIFNFPSGLGSVYFPSKPVFRFSSFSSDVGCLFRWRWTVEVGSSGSSTLSVEAAFTLSPCHQGEETYTMYVSQSVVGGRYTRYTMYVTVCPVLSRRFMRDTSLGHEWARKLAFILRAICLFVFPVM